MAKPLPDAKAKAARQKKIAIGGAVLLVALLAYQVPKTMKMLNAKPAASAAPAATTTAAPGAAPATTTATPGATTPAAPAGATSVDGLVVNADLSPAPLDGQLLALTATFTSKDPFRQQLNTTTTSETTTPTTTTPTKPGGSVVPPGSTTPTTTTPSTPTAPPVSATISVNGVEGSVGVGSDFPADTPLFHLVSLTAKTAKISIAGGSLSSGAPTITLTRGVPLTLMNTADGTRYRLVLVATSSSSAAPAAPATTPTTTTETTTTSTTPAG